jgi:hypothetical protein
LGPDDSPEVLDFDAEDLFGILCSKVSMKWVFLRSLSVNVTAIKNIKMSSSEEGNNADLQWRVQWREREKADAMRRL